MQHDELIALVEQRNPHTVFGPLGIRVVSYDPDALQVALDIDERHHQHFGMLHGGVSVLLAESAASLAAALSVDVRTHTVAGVDISATHLRPKQSGRLIATAKPLFRGRTTHVYEIAIHDDGGKLVCASRCTIAVRKRASDVAGA
jgi:1,4-dihydroxy-2-naphthoyl-CoA hydrolase